MSPVRPCPLESRRGAAASPALRMIFFIKDPASPKISTLSLHDALPISSSRNASSFSGSSGGGLACSAAWKNSRSEEHTSELQSHVNIVCRLLLEKKTRQLHLPVGARPLKGCEDRPPPPPPGMPSGQPRR